MAMDEIELHGKREGKWSPLPSKEELKNGLGILLLAGVVYGAAYFAMGDFVLPGGPVFPLVLIWLSAHLLGWITEKYLFMPGLLGMLVAGCILINMPGHPAASLPKKWAKEIRYGAMSIIFLRSGLEQDLDVFKKIGGVAVRLLLIPGIVEALVSGLVAWPVFGMPVLLALALGFILKPVDPAIAISMMFRLQNEGKGVKKGIPALVVAAASFDDLVALTFYTLFINFAMPPGDNPAWDIAKGPMNVVFGAIAGGLGSLLCSMTKIWNTRMKRTLVVLLTTLFNMFLLVKFDFSGAGVLSAIMLGVVTSVLWTKGLPGFLSQGQNPHYAVAVEHHIAKFWDWVAQPLLFGIVGTLVNFKYIDFGTLPYSIIVILSGWFTRMPVTFFSVMGAGLTWRERMFVMLAWTPKATVQAALASDPLEQISADDRLGPEWTVWGNQILVTALFAVIICGPLGVLTTSLGTKYLMKPDEKEAGEPSLHRDSLIPAFIEPSDASAPMSFTAQKKAKDDPFKKIPELEEVAEEDMINELTKEQLMDLYEDEILLENDVGRGRVLRQLEQEIEAINDMDSLGDKHELAEKLHNRLRQLRKLLVEQEVPNMDHVDGAKDFFRRTSVYRNAGHAGSQYESARSITEMQHRG